MKPALGTSFDKTRPKRGVCEPEECELAHHMCMLVGTCGTTTCMYMYMCTCHMHVRGHMAWGVHVEVFRATYV